MNEEVISGKISEHDRHIDSLSTAIEHLVETTAVTNLKLDKMVEMLSTQNVIKERLSNLEENLKESFERVHVRQDKISGRVDKLEPVVEKTPTPATIRWAVGIIIGYLILSGNYIVSHIHELESSTEAHAQTGHIYIQEFTKRLNKLENMK